MMEERRGFNSNNNLQRRRNLPSSSVSSHSPPIIENNSTNHNNRTNNSRQQQLEQLRQRLDEELQAEQRQLQEIHELYSTANKVLFFFSLALALFTVKIHLPQFIDCVYLSAISSLLITFLNFFSLSYFVERFPWNWIFAILVFIHLMILLSSVVVEFFLYSSYMNCERGEFCANFQSLTWHWPYGGVIAISIVILIVSFYLFYLFISLVGYTRDNQNNRRGIEEQPMEIGSEENGERNGNGRIMGGFLEMKTRSVYRRSNDVNYEENDERTQLKDGV